MKHLWDLCLRPPESSPHSEQATLQALLQDILHTLPALAQAPAEATPAPVHCGRTKVFMTDSTVSWLGMRSGQPHAVLSRTGSGPS